MFDIFIDLLLQFIQVLPVFLVVFIFAGLVSGWTR